MIEKERLETRLQENGSSVDSRCIHLSRKADELFLIQTSGYSKMRGGVKMGG
jgi:hypothetical protein